MIKKIRKTFNKHFQIPKKLTIPIKNNHGL